MAVVDAIVAHHAVTLIPQRAALNAEIITRHEVAVVVLDHALNAYVDRGGNLSTPSAAAALARRDTLRDSARMLRIRAASPEYT